MPEEPVVVKSGEETSEHKVQKSNSVTSIIIAVIGVVTSVGSVVATQLGTESTIGIIVGGVIAIVGLLSKMMTDLGYIKSRTDVKAAASLGKETD